MKNRNTIKQLLIAIPFGIPIVLAAVTAITAIAEEMIGEESRSRTVSVEDCRRLTNHTVGDDVAFKPGVDVRGQAVTPADVTPALKIESMENIKIDFGIDLGKKYSLSSDDSAEAMTHIATITYNMKNNTFELDGKTLDRDDNKAIADACKIALE